VKKGSIQRVDEKAGELKRLQEAGNKDAMICWEATGLN